ncbi:sensor histidine kinase [Rhodoferax fermentans]|uniref:C4-dicarboxylate transport sensor protein DctB n=1 Tax=Rhodoferax fermentans TaxID=28066 RepID=A0A1T1APW6_RHOFE|nr:ATP-binding protein [Rhodoferax fermentans]OOV06023.1 sensor histidine kinase [Rhodoferax fermentans]
MFTRQPLRFSLLLLVLTALVAATSLTTYQISQRMGLTELQTTGRHRLDLYTASLEREIGKYAYFPATLGLERDVLDVLTQADDPRRTAQANVYLERLNERAGTLAIYVINDQGTVRATSNWRRSDSYLGEDLAFRPYFREAMDTGSGRFFGIGTTRSEPGYYLSSALSDDSRTLGVAIVKVGLDQLEQSWSTVEAPVLVADENGVVILSSVPDWKFTTLRPLDEGTRKSFDRTQQYNRRALQPLGVREMGDLSQGARLVQLAKQPQEMVSAYPVAGNFLAQSQAMPGTPWTLTVFSHVKPVNEMSFIRASVAGVTTILLWILASMVYQRRRHLRDRLAAREALQKAHDELERKVEERTADLSCANQQLQDEVVERVRAERTLRAAQDELIQAGKLAVIGQLSAGIAHELNQPLAALRTLSGNAVRFLERGDDSTARSNLERIAQLVDRMGLITGQLKAFAHKSSGQARPVDICQVVTHAVAILDQRLRSSGAEVKMDFPDAALFALCDANRLEQVIVNLLSNALDAMVGHTRPGLEIHGTTQGSMLRLTVRDHGVGLSAEVLARLFEPFFTTKEAGVGLGLGLVISAGIVSDFGGTLSGANHPDGGAVFTLDIPLATPAP